MTMMADDPPESVYHQENAVDSDGLHGGEWSDNLSISFDSLMAFLDDDNSGLPPDTLPSQVGYQDQEMKPSAGQNFLDNNAFQPYLESSPNRELGSFHWDGAKDLDVTRKESNLDFSHICKENLSIPCSSHQSMQTDNDATHGLADSRSMLSNYVGLSGPEVNSSLIGSSRCFLNSSTGENLDHHPSWKNIASSNASMIRPEEESLFRSQDTNSYQRFNFDSSKSCNYNQVQIGSFAQLDIRSQGFNANNQSSIYEVKGGGTDLSYFLLPEGSALTDNVHHDVAEPNTFMQEGDCFASLARDFSIHPHATFGDSFCTDMNANGATNMRNASNSNLTSYRQPAVDFSGNDLMNFFHIQLPQQTIDHENEVNLQAKAEKDEGDERLSSSDNSCSSSEVDLDSQSIEYDEVFTETPAKLNYNRDSSFRSESSTDSSPLPSRRNSTSGYLDAPKESGALSEFNIHNMKEVVFLDNGRKDKKIASYGKQFENYAISNTSKDNNITSCSRQSEKCAIRPITNISSFQSNLLRSSSVVDDSDICIIDDISFPARPPNRLVRPHLVAERSPFHDQYDLGVGGMRIESNDERLTFHLALQDLSQSKSEANPPEGLLAVPLLRHQRIALSWMVQKETNSIHCSGGILADDQGLGKTISTIALILTERSPPSTPSITNDVQGIEAWNLDDDDDDEYDASALHDIKKPRISGSLVINGSEKKDNTRTVVTSRPAAGTLVVCPTSVLRQWAEELRVKVTEKAKLSFLIYHGSNRTKDPDELAKYDVVLTTYAIVSMEVPKQPLADKDDDEATKSDISGSRGDSANKKNKNKKRSNDQNVAETALQESAARPLARVRWFRVILDEAQSIKNYRTQVARACWGLRAKRRWCLSGTPIQNAIDDLYSYFRFLKFEPYSIYKSFHSTLKMPINRHPVNGYKKLQAVLKTIMLRRTKGTLLDGKPIISLPPKTVTLKKVDFSNDERLFYLSLEAESREQFKVYAALGTVKQNYVNILLMLLRLRQACDHPLLVKGCNSNASWKSSLEAAKKLSKEQLKDLLSCLEGCSAICVICNDPPEDAVVTVCGHVFCNQCICEHLIGEENICPSVGCKVRLNVASVFSRSTLVSSMTEADACISRCSSDAGDTTDIHATNFSSDSSKIKAAVEILKSLPRVESCSSGSLVKSDSEGSENLVTEANGTIQNISVFSSHKCSTNLDVARNLVSCKLQRPVTEKAIVFSQWTRMLDLLEIPLKGSCIEYRRLDGTMSVSARDKAVKDFNTCPEVSVMIMSLKAASLGLNMVSACHVILLDLWWNPTTEDQAIDRAHRIGQTRPVTVSRLTVKDTVEDRILGLQQKKREMVASAFGEDESGSRQTRLTVDDLKYLFMVP